MRGVALLVTGIHSVDFDSFPVRILPFMDTKTLENLPITLKQE